MERPDQPEEPKRSPLEIAEFLAAGLRQMRLAMIHPSMSGTYGQNHWNILGQSLIDSANELEEDLRKAE